MKDAQNHNGFIARAIDDQIIRMDDHFPCASYSAWAMPFWIFGEIYRLGLDIVLHALRGVRVIVRYVVDYCQQIGASAFSPLNP